MKLKWIKFKTSQGFSAFLMLILIIAVNIFLQGRRFVNASSINSIFIVNTPLILATIAQSIIIFCGGIDLSIGATLSVVNAFAITAAQHIPLFAAWIGAFLIAVLISLINGYLFAYCRIPAILSTFAMTSVIEGLALLILPRPGGLVPSYIYEVYGNAIGGIFPVSAIIVIAAIGIYTLVEMREAGAQIKAAGASPRNLFIDGVDVAKTRLKAYLISGCFTGAAGLCLTALASSGDPTIGNEMSLNTIAAAILGGVSLSGGIGSVGGAVAGALFMSIVKNMINYIFNNLVSSSTVFSIKISNLQSLLTNIIVILGLCSNLLTKIGKRRRK